MTIIKSMPFICAFLISLGVFNVYAQNRDMLFPEKPGLVSYTYRKDFGKDVPATLDKIKSLGITDMEFSNLFGKTASELRTLIDERGIKCSSFGVSYSDLVNKTTEVAQKAKTLGADYVRVASIPYKSVFTVEDAQRAVDDFNRVGKILKEEHGLTFAYHNHGFEFQTYQDGTLYDFIVKKTNPKYVSFELDILWAFFPGHDPVQLLNKYGKRYKLMHLKDLRKGVPGNMSGGTSPENDVVFGTGQIDIPSILRAAKKAGVRHYYIEDESSNVDVQVPASILYLQNLKKSGIQKSNVLTNNEKQSGWKLLFDGKTLNGWKKLSDSGWDIEDGELRAQVFTTGGTKDIITTDQFENFELSMEFKIFKATNSGFKYLVTNNYPGYENSYLGLEYQILDNVNFKYPERGVYRSLASLYDLIPSSSKEIVGFDNWNIAKIIVKGNHIEHWLNGEKVVEYDRSTNHFDSLVAGSKYKNMKNFGKGTTGHILLQNEGTPVIFRSIKIKPL